MELQKIRVWNSGYFFLYSGSTGLVSLTRCLSTATEGHSHFPGQEVALRRHRNKWMQVNVFQLLSKLQESHMLGDCHLQLQTSMEESFLPFQGWLPTSSTFRQDLMCRRPSITTMALRGRREESLHSEPHLDVPLQCNPISVYKQASFQAIHKYLYYAFYQCYIN